MPRRIRIGLVALVFALAATACADDRVAADGSSGASGTTAGGGGSSDGTSGGSGANDSPTQVATGTFQVRPVLGIVAPSSAEALTCDGGDAGCLAEHADDARIVLLARDGNRYALGPVAVTEADVASAGVVENASTSDWDVVVQLTPEATPAFAELTRDEVGNALAFVVDGTVLSAPTVQTAITGGALAIGHLDRATAEAVAATLGGPP